MPGVEDAALVAVPYIANDLSRTDFTPEGSAKDKDTDSGEDTNVVGNNFFSLMHIPIVNGRSFGLQDTATSTKVAIINASLAKARFPNQSPVGRRFYGSNQVLYQIVGVCGDTRYANLRDDPPPQFLTPFVQEKDASGTWTYAIRTRTSPDSVIPLARRLLQNMDPDVPMINVRTQQQQIESTTQQERIFVALTSGFGILALLLAAVGIYGIMAYSVAGRTNEIGIRLALGAMPGQVLGMILREATWISLAGVAVGLGAALVLAQAVKSMLYGLQPADPVSLICGAGLLIAVGLLASWIPARRAAKIQPMEALRHE